MTLASPVPPAITPVTAGSVPDAAKGRTPLPTIDAAILIQHYKAGLLIRAATRYHYQVLAGHAVPGCPLHLLWIDLCRWRSEKNIEKKSEIWAEILANPAY